MSFSLDLKRLGCEPSELDLVVALPIDTVLERLREMAALAEPRSGERFQIDFDGRELAITPPRHSDESFRATCRGSIIPIRDGARVQLRECRPTNGSLAVTGGMSIVALTVTGLVAVKLVAVNAVLGASAIVGFSIAWATVIHLVSRSASEFAASASIQLVSRALATAILSDSHNLPLSSGGAIRRDSSPNGSLHS